MVHYSCDLCGRSLDGLRFSVAIELVRHEPTESHVLPDSNHDFLDQIEDELLKLDSTSEFYVPAPVKKTIHKDLCLSCAQRFEKDPLARDVGQRFNSSAN